jgi:hypothetical protein
MGRKRVMKLCLIIMPVLLLLLVPSLRHVLRQVLRVHGQNVSVAWVSAIGQGSVPATFGYESRPPRAGARGEVTAILLEPREKFSGSREEILKNIAGLQWKHRQALEKLSPSFEKLQEAEQKSFLDGLLAVSRNRGQLSRFLETLLEPLRSETAEFLAATFRLQDGYLALDGRGPESLIPRTGRMPTQLEDQAERVRSKTYGAEVESFMSQVAQRDSVHHEDIEKLGRFCESLTQDRKGCIEKGVLSWLDSNHLLTDQQMEQVEKLSVD